MLSVMKGVSRNRNISELGIVFDPPVCVCVCSLVYVFVIQKKATSCMYELELEM